MSMVGDRAEIAAALTALAGVTGYPYRPHTFKAGDGWPLWAGAERDDAPGWVFLHTWNVVIALPGQERDATQWIDTNFEALADALRPVGHIIRVEPANLGASEETPVFGLMFVLERE